MKLILRFINPYRRLLLFVLLVMILDVAGGLLIPTITADIINKGIGGGNLSYIIRQGVLMTVIALITSFGALAGSYLCAVLSARVGRDIRDAVYDHSLKFSASDMESIGTGSMITRTLNDVNVIQQSVIMVAQMILPVPVVCVLGIVMAFRIDMVMGWILAGVTVVILLLAVLVVQKAAPMFERLQRFLDRMNVVIRENVTGVRVIRAFDKEAYEEGRMDGVFENYRNVSIQVCRLFAGLESTAVLVINLIIIVILYMGGNRTGAGAMEIGDITALTEYAIIILFYLVMAQMVMVMLPRALVCIERIRQVLELEPEIRDGTDPGERMKRPGKKANDCGKAAVLPGNRETPVLCFENVSFRFADADECTLSGMDFACKRGQTTAVIGSTGSGKSVLTRLILRLHDVTEGKILMHGTDIREMSQADLRSRISYVPQKAWLFAGTIADNLRHGDADASEEKMWKILDVAQAGFVRELRGGLEARVAQGGTNFSGGQKQRLSIARALMKEADLYIFDDSFSALDFKTDAELRKALADQIKDAAVLIVAQRVSTIVNADQILVLEDGRVVGIGTHQSLIDTCPVYREIARSQMRGGETDGK